MTSLGEDLRDGVRLCKLVQVLTDDAAPLEALKYPANSKAVTKYNVNLALEGFAKHKCSVTLCANAADIMVGHRERTLALLWRVMSNWKVMELIDEVGPAHG